MDSSYKLGKKKKLFELAEFPIINKGDKVVILFTGGVKSYLAAYIAKQMYGIENVICIIIIQKSRCIHTHTQTYIIIDNNLHIHIKDHLVIQLCT